MSKDIKKIMKFVRVKTEPFAFAYMSFVTLLVLKVTLLSDFNKNR